MWAYNAVFRNLASTRDLVLNELLILIIGLCILLGVYLLNIGITSVRNKVFLVLDFIVHFSHNTI
jgi:hypothetical protein